jgi:uncharacterized OB-fold protein
MSSLMLQVCADCGYVHYPTHAVCRSCLSETLSDRPFTDTGTVLAKIELFNSMDPVFTKHLPWSVATIKLDAGPVVIAHSRTNEQRVNLRYVRDHLGRRVLATNGAALPTDIFTEE